MQESAEPDPLLGELHWIDFSDLSNYTRRLDALLQSISTPDAAVSLTDPPNNTPPLPERLVERPEIVGRLREALFRDDEPCHISLTALQGMGIGKSVLPQALCHHRIVRRTYPDGIFWFNIGKESHLPLQERIPALPALRRCWHSGPGSGMHQQRPARDA